MVCHHAFGACIDLQQTDAAAQQCVAGGLHQHFKTHMWKMSKCSSTLVEKHAGTPYPCMQGCSPVEDVPTAQQCHCTAASEGLVAHSTLLTGRFACRQQQRIVGGEAGARTSNISLQADSNVLDVLQM
jgi:hypothetical protein